MKFDEFWNILRKELKTKRELETSKHHKKFTAYFKDNDSIIIEPKQGKKPVTLKVKNMLFVWNTAKTMRLSERFKVKHYRNKIGTASYTVTFLKDFLGDQEMK